MHRMRNTLACVCAVLTTVSHAQEPKPNPLRERVTQVQERVSWNPPARYDNNGPWFEGTRTLSIRQLPQHEVIGACQILFDANGANIEATPTQRGCAWRSHDHRTCYVITVSHTYLGSSPDAVLRHEMGHCNGWPNNHPK